MRKHRDLMDWLANTKSGTAVLLASSAVMGIAIAIVALKLSAS